MTGPKQKDGGMHSGFDRCGEELRAIYSESAGCRTQFAGRPVSVGAFTVRSMNFGQHWRTPRAHDDDYSIQLPLTFVRDYLNHNLREWCSEAQGDPDPHDLLGNAMRSSDWPSVDSVLCRPDLLALVLQAFGNDLLDVWCGARSLGAVDHFIVNTTDRIDLDGELVCISGRALRRNGPLAYQDE